MRWSIVRLIAVRECAICSRSAHRLPDRGAAHLPLPRHRHRRTAAVAGLRGPARPCRHPQRGRRVPAALAARRRTQPAASRGLAHPRAGSAGWPGRSPGRRRRPGPGEPAAPGIIRRWRDGQLEPFCFDTQFDAALLQIKLLSPDDTSALEERRVDALLMAPADFWRLLEQEGRPAVQVEGRDDDRSAPGQPASEQRPGPLEAAADRGAFAAPRIARPLR